MTSRPEREAVITGTGLVTPLGKSVKENWESFRTGRTGIGTYPDEKHPRQFHCLGKVSDLEIPPELPAALRKELKYLNRSSQLGVIAAMEAVSEAGVDFHAIPPERRGLFVASGDHTRVGYEFFHPAIRAAIQGGSGSIDWERLNRTALEEVNPFFLLESMHNNAFSFLAALFDLRGPNACLASLSPCGLQALELAGRAILHDQVEAALVVASSNWVSEVPLRELHQLGLLSEGKFGVNSMRPFDRHRDGLIPGEGGAAVLLESSREAKSEGRAMQRFVPAFGTGEGTPCRADGQSPPPRYLSPMQRVLQSGVSNFTDLGFVILHGCADVFGDHSELQSLHESFGEEAAEVPVCGIKGSTGHLGAASDLAETILGSVALRAGLVPGTRNFESTESPFEHLRISPDLQRCTKERFMVASRGMGGAAAAVMMGYG